MRTFLFLIIFISNLQAAEYFCPPTLTGGAEKPEGYEFVGDTKWSLGLLGASYEAPNFRCFYGIGSWMIEKKVTGKCFLIASPKPHRFIPQARQCLGNNQHCRLVCE